MIRLKFCGLRRFKDVEYVNAAKPDYAGFILSSGFKRSVETYDFFTELESSLDDNIKRVGVFVNEPLEHFSRVAPLLDAVQLHGDEDEGYIAELRKVFDGEIWKAVRLRDVSDIERTAVSDADRYVLDAFSENAVGGTGKRIDADLLRKAVPLLNKPFFIAGGITAENITETAREFSPYGIDLSGGIETDGVKDMRKMENIVSILREENLR